jgi:four helix bundle protein
MRKRETKHPTSNIQHPTSNGYAGGRTFDLEERMLAHAARIVRLYDLLPAGSGAKQIGNQLVRSGTSPYLHHGEVEAAESKADFIRKLKICLKELRETWRALRVLKAIDAYRDANEIESLIDETHQLIRILWKSVQTVQSRTDTPNVLREDATANEDWMLDVGRWMLDVSPTKEALP